nr:lipoprotein LpqH [Mycobacterium intermedium]
MTTVAAVFVAALVGACDAQPPTELSSTASVTVDGKDAKVPVVKCTQVQWYRTIHIGGDFAGATVFLDGRGAKPFAESVRIKNMGGFTGMYSKGGQGDANLSVSGKSFTITGTAQGYKFDKPNDPVTANFKITVSC